MVRMKHCNKPGHYQVIRDTTGKVYKCKYCEDAKYE